MITTILLTAILSAPGGGFEPDQICYLPPNKRGDLTGDDLVTLEDVTRLTQYLYEGCCILHCQDQADFNGDGSVDQSDIIAILLWLFSDDVVPEPDYVDC